MVTGGMWSPSYGPLVPIKPLLVASAASRYPLSMLSFSG